MAKIEHRTYTYTCDLCGADREEDELADLYGKPEHSLNGHSQSPRADICGDCQARPIGDLLDHFEQTRKPALPFITARTEPARPVRARLKNAPDATRSAGDMASDVG